MATGNCVRVKWSPPENGKVPENSFTICEPNSSSQYIVLEQITDDKYGKEWIVKCLETTIKEPSEDMLFLVANKADLEWKLYNQDATLTGKVPCHRSNWKLGNIYIGKHEGILGMVGSTSPGVWKFYSGNNKMPLTNNFYVLCAASKETV